MGWFSRGKKGGAGAQEPPRDPDADLFDDVDADGKATAPESIELPIDGTLDLHTFHPSEVKGLLADYFAACREKAIFEVRVVHGKGTGALRRTVHSLLERDAGVESFRLSDERGGNWGATLVILKKGD